MRLLFLSFVSLYLFFLANEILAAACCGGGLSVPSVIAGDHKAQFSIGYSYTDVVVDNVDTRGLWRKWEASQTVESFRLETAHLISDRWQWGGSLPLIRRRQLDESYEGVGDVSLSLGYEYLPDWDYNPLRPKGLSFIQLTLPTGKARAESELGGLDSRGNGFWALGVGSLLSKNWGRWDVFTQFEVHHSFKKSVDHSQINGELDPGFGGSWGLGGGYNRRDFRVGTSITWMYEDPIDLEGESGYKGSAERYATGTLSLSYLYSPEWMASMSYSDQTWFGDPINTSLGRSLGFVLQKRWAR